MRRRVKPKKNVPGLRSPSAPLPGTRRAWLLLGVILLIAAALRAGYLAELVERPDYDSPLSDAKYNDYWARARAAGNWTPPADEPDPLIQSAPFFRPPGYPYFLAAIYFIAGESYLAARVVQMLVGVVSCFLGFLLGRAVFNRNVGLVFAALMSVYWAFIYFEGEFQPPVLLVLLGFLLMLTVHRWQVRPTGLKALLAGLLLGALSLIRQNFLLFVPVLLVWMCWVLYRRTAAKRLRMTAPCLVAGLAVVVTPVAIRNYAVADDLVLISSNGGINLYIGNNERTSLVAPRIPDLEQIAGRSGWNLFAYPQIIRGVERIEQRPMKHSEVSSYFAARAWAFIRSHPPTALSHAIKRLLLFWGPEEVSNSKVDHYERADSVVLRFLPTFPMALAGFLVGFWWWLYDRHRAAAPVQGGTTQAPPNLETPLLMLLFAAAYAVSFMPFLAAGRFRVPVIPWLLLFAAYGLCRLGRLFAEKQYKAATVHLTALAALYGLAGISVVPYQPDLASWHLDRASAYTQKQRIDLAIPEYQAALQANPSSPDTYALLGSACASLGRFDEAVANYRKGIDKCPTFAELRRKLALLLFHLDRLDESIAEFRAALQISSDNAEAWYNLGRALRRRGDDSGAAEAYRQVTQLDPQFAEARVNLGSILQGQNRLEEAKAEFRKAIEINPNLFEAHFNLASALATEGKANEAFRELSIALSIRPDHAEAQRALKLVQEMRRDSKAMPIDQPPGSAP